MIRAITTAVVIGYAFALAYDARADVPTEAVRTSSYDDLCPVAHTDLYRHVTERDKHFVFVRDGVPDGNHTGKCDGDGGCEVDHRISLELGGSNSVSNLMIQPYFGACNAHQKDRLENLMHRMVCARVITSSYAQNAIYNDWEIAYSKFVDPDGCRD